MLLSLQTLLLTLINANSLCLGVLNSTGTGQPILDLDLDVQVDDCTSTADDAQNPDEAHEELEIDMDIDV